MFTIQTPRIWHTGVTHALVIFITSEQNQNEVYYNIMAITYAPIGSVIAATIYLSVYSRGQSK